MVPICIQIQGSQFTCFTSAKVQILTRQRGQDAGEAVGRSFRSDICVPHIANVSSYCYIYVLILLYTCVLYMCPHTAMYVRPWGGVSGLIYVSSYCYIRVLILAYTCPHAAVGRGCRFSVYLLY